MKRLMTVCAAAIAAVAMAFAAEAKTWYVTPEGGGDGSAWQSPMTLDEASSAAQSGDEVWVKAGADYVLTAPLFTTQAVTVRGGFAGTEATADERTGSDVSVFDGTSVDNCIANTAATGTLVLDRLELKNSIYRGLYKTGDANLQMVGCRIIGNGKVPGVPVKQTGYHGRGIYVAGTAAKSSTVTITDCRFEDNVRPLNAAFDWQSTANYGTGAYFSSLSGVTISGTDFIGNGLTHDNTSSWYWGSRSPSRDYARGSAVYSNNVKMTVDHCRFIGNRETTNGANDGGCVVVYGGSGSSFAHCLWAGNDGLFWSASSLGRNAAVVFQAASASDAYSMNHCTVAYNVGCWSTVAGVACYGGNLSIVNSIIYGNVADKDKGVAADLYAGSVSGFNASVTVDYSLVTSKADPYAVAAANCSIEFKEHVKEGDPLFATDFQTAGSYLHNMMTTPSAKLEDNTDMYAKLPLELEALLDFHLKSPKGRWNGTDWYVGDTIFSPAIDNGDPESAYNLEPRPNGGIANLGFYGNTAEASKSDGLVVWYVTPAGGGDGTSWQSPTTLTAASAAAQAGDEIWVKAGADYVLTEPLFTRYAVIVRGGFAGTEATADERTGTGVSVFDGTSVDTCIDNTASSGTLVLDRIELKNAIYRGLKKVGDANLELKGCRIIGNGTCAGVSGTATCYKGRGLYIEGTTANKASVLIENCRIANNVQPLGSIFDWQNTTSHGAGAYFKTLAGVTVKNTAFVGNGLFRAPEKAGWNGIAPARGYAHGAAFFSDGVKMTVSGCTFIGNRETLNNSMTGNQPGDGGTAVVWGGSGSSFSHCLWACNDGLRFGDSSEGDGAAVLFISTAAGDAYSMDHCTVAYNMADHTRMSGIACYGGKLTLRNSIVYGNVVGKTMGLASDIYAGSYGGRNATIDVDYSMVTGKEAPYVAAATGCLVDFGDNVKTGDPLLATTFATAGSWLAVALTEPTPTFTMDLNLFRKTGDELEQLVDFHLKSGKGRWNGTAWVKDSGVRSQAIDAGDPTADYSLEPEPNGKCVNLGCYGATAEASKGRSLMGLFLVVE